MIFFKRYCKIILVLLFIALFYLNYLNEWASYLFYYYVIGILAYPHKKAKAKTLAFLNTSFYTAGFIYNMAGLEELKIYTFIPLWLGVIVVVGLVFCLNDSLVEFFNKKLAEEQ